MIATSNIESNSSSGLLIALEALAENVNVILTNSTGSNINSTKSNFQQGTGNIAFSINRQRFIEDTYVVSRTIGNTVYVNFTSDVNEAQITPEVSSIIKIPKETFMNSTETVYSYYFKQSSLFLTEQEIQNYKNNRTHIDSFVDSNILSATVGFREVKNLTKPIILTFKKSLIADVAGTHSCYFWSPYVSKCIFL